MANEINFLYMTHKKLSFKFDYLQQSLYVVQWVAGSSFMMCLHAVICQFGVATNCKNLRTFSNLNFISWHPMLLLPSLSSLLVCGIYSIIENVTSSWQSLLQAITIISKTFIFHLQKFLPVFLPPPHSSLNKKVLFVSFTEKGRKSIKSRERKGNRQRQKWDEMQEKHWIIFTMVLKAYQHFFPSTELYSITLFYQPLRICV